MTTTNQYKPDYAVPPGAILAERLDVNEMSHAEFARRCGRSPKLISEIIAGKAPVEAATALQFERVLGVDASVWVALEANYQLDIARQSVPSSETAAGKWVKAFPVRELVERQCLSAPTNHAEAISQLLSFFRVGSIDAWMHRYAADNVVYRRPTKFLSSQAALAAWRRCGEIFSESQECKAFSEASFRNSLKRIRSLTTRPVEEGLKQAIAACNDAGVAVAIVPPLPNAAVSGAAWWLKPSKAVIALSGRYRSADHLWFSFYHEAAHILLHSKKSVFIDEVTTADGPTKNAAEAEADEWAANSLIPSKAADAFCARSRFEAADIRAFAVEQGVAAGIVVGMLQHRGCISWARLNHLKEKLDPNSLVEIHTHSPSTTASIG